MRPQPEPTDVLGRRGWLRQQLRETLPQCSDDEIGSLITVAEEYGRKLHEQAIRDGRAAPPGRLEHHAGIWSILPDGECGCECVRCWQHDECACSDCTCLSHDHSSRTQAALREDQP